MPWLSAKDTAAHHGVSLETLRRWARTGRIESRQMPGVGRGGVISEYLVPVTAVQEPVQSRSKDQADHAAEAATNHATNHAAQTPVVIAFPGINHAGAPTNHATNHAAWLIEDVATTGENTDQPCAPPKVPPERAIRRNFRKSVDFDGPTNHVARPVDLSGQPEAPPTNHAQPEPAELTMRSTMRSAGLYSGDPSRIFGTVDEVAEALLVTPRAVTKMIAEGGLATTQIENRTRGLGGHEYTHRIDVRQLPFEAQCRYWSLKLSAGGRGESTDLGRRCDRGQLQVDAAELSDPKRRDQVRAVQMFLAKPPGYSNNAWAQLVGRTFGITRQHVYRLKAEMTGRRWGSQTRRQTQRVTIDIEGVGSKVVSTRSFDESFIRCALGLFIASKGRKSRTKIYAETVAAADEHGWRYGSEKAFLNLMTTLVPQDRHDPLYIYTMRGPRALLNDAVPPILRDHTVYHAMEMVVGDQKVMDFLVVGDDGRTFQPQLYLWSDFRTRTIVGWSISVGAYDSYQVGLALQMACAWGRPERLYTDNGKPELSRYVDHVRASLSGYCGVGFHHTDELPVARTKAKVKNARAKPNERMHRELDKYLLQDQNVPGYCRRQHDDDRNDWLKADLKAEIHGGRLLSIDEFREEVAKGIATWNTTVHQIGEEKFAPLSELVRLLGERPVPRFSAQALDYIFLPFEDRKVRTAMVTVTIKGLGKLHYRADELMLHQGKDLKVRVRVRPDAPDRAYISDARTEDLIAVADRYGRINPKDGDQVMAGIEMQQRMMRKMRESIAEWTAFARDHVIGEAPQIASRHGQAARKAAKIESAIDELKLDRLRPLESMRKAYGY